MIDPVDFGESGENTRQVRKQNEVDQLEVISISSNLNTNDPKDKSIDDASACTVCQQG